MTTVNSGLEVFIRTHKNSNKNERFGLLANPASVNKNYEHAKDLINRHFPGQLTTLFSPQHGFFADKQDNMIESDHTHDSLLNLPVYSLYGETRIPSKEMYDNIDTLLVDIQDVGTRVYTFIYTLSYCMEVAAENKKKVVVLDRPNPVGGLAVEGNLLQPEFSSFVGRFPIPMRHGLTIGEIALLFNEHFNINCDLEVVHLENWERKMYFQETGLPWILPSPNLPTVESAMVYPGQVIFEGTNISEARGTTLPFEVFGAPFVSTEKIIDFIDPFFLKGIHLRPVMFEPTSNKWAGQTCRGFQIHITDRTVYNSYSTSLALLQALMATSGDSFEWKQPPYEYEFEKLPIDLILGDKALRKKIENIEPMKKIEASWQEELESFRQLKQTYHFYK